MAAVAAAIATTTAAAAAAANNAIDDNDDNDDDDPREDCGELMVPCHTQVVRIHGSGGSGILVLVCSS